MAGETFGSGITQKVADVIAKREEIFGKKSRNIEEQQLLNSNTAWVKLRSSVNIADPKVAEALAANKDPKQADYDDFFKTADSDLAKKYVLMSGTRNAFTKSEKNGPPPPGQRVRSGVANNNDTNGEPSYDYTKAYNWDDDLGYRPMSGITDISVKSKNTYGTLQVAEVSFVVWSLKELNDVSELYFKPGFSALLEFGHSVYVDKEGNIQKTGTSNGTIGDTKFFSPTTFADIDGAGNYLKEKGHSYNYEYLLGFITNFNWSFRQDGGYDCSLKITSRGNVLDSIKPGVSRTGKNKSDEDKEEDKEKLKSTWHHHFVVIEEAYTGLARSEQRRRVIDGNKFLDDDNSSLDGSKLKPFKAFGYEVDITDGATAWITNEDSINQRYVPLYTVLDIFNTFATIKDPEKGQTLIKFNIESDNEYFTFDDHFAIDPLPVVLPKIPTGKVILEDSPTIDLSKFTLTRSGLHEDIAKFAGDNKNKIMYIMVSTHTVKSELNKVIDSTNDGLGTLDALRGILATINTALGGINDLDISKEDDGTYVVVDRKNTSNKKPPIIGIKGLSSTIVNLDLSSTISNQIASQISIAAQGTQGNFADNVSSILRWNINTVDRHFKRKESSSDKEDVDDQRKQELKDLEKYVGVWEDFNEFDSDYLSTTWTSTKPAAQNLLRRLAHEAMHKNKVIPGVIPVELKIKMLGISGMKVGQSFLIEEGVLPERYNSFGYIITGLGHEVGTDNKWYTNITTQFYSI